MNNTVYLYRLRIRAEGISGDLYERTVVAHKAQEAISKVKLDRDEYAASVEIISEIDIL